MAPLFSIAAGCGQRIVLVEDVIETLVVHRPTWIVHPILDRAEVVRGSEREPSGTDEQITTLALIVVGHRVDSFPSKHQERREEHHKVDSSPDKSRVPPFDLVLRQSLSSRLVREQVVDEPS